MILALFLLLAQAHEWPESKPNASVEEKCKDSCRQKHCTSWLSCNNLDESKAREECKDRTNDDEMRCQKSCGESRI